MDTQIPDRLPQLDRGSHTRDSHKMCSMEAVSWLAGESFTDRPFCVNELICDIAIETNDDPDMTDERRQAMWPLLLRCMGTRETFGSIKNAEYSQEISPTDEMYRRNKETENLMMQWYQSKDEQEEVSFKTTKLLEETLAYFDEISGRKKLPDLTREDWTRLFEYAQFEEVS